MATTSVTSGQTANGTISSGSTEYILSGGVASAQNNYGGTRIVSSGGVISGDNTYIQNGAVDQVLAGGIEYGGLFGGATLSVSSGGTAINSFINGGTATAAGGAVLSNTRVAGGLVSGTNTTTLSGAINVSGGTISGTQLLGSGTVETLSAGAITQDQYNYTSRVVSSGAIVRNGVVGSSGTDQILAGGSAFQGLIQGTRNVSSGAVVTDPYVAGGGVVNVANGATLNSAYLYNGGVINAGSSALLGGVISGGGTVSGGILSGPSTVETLTSGGGVYGQSVVSGASASLTNGSLASALDVGNGGTLQILGGTASNTSVLSGGSVSVNGGSPQNMSVNGGAVDIIKTSGGASVFFGSSGGTITLESGNTFSNASSAYWVSSGGTYVVHSGARVNGGNVLSGGVMVVDGGTTSGVVLDGGDLYLNNVGATSGTTFTSNGGTLHLESGYQGNQTWAFNNNVHVVLSSGASLPNTTVSATATVDVQSGASIASTTVLSGGRVAVASGGTIASLLTVSSGGTAVLNGPAGSGTISLAGDGSQLTISGTQMPTNVISGFTTNDRIDLASVPQSSITGIDRTASGITVRTANGTNYALNVPGASSVGYQLVSDGNGGTVYTTCFAEGTLIATPEGAVAVEDLAEGVLVKTPKGAMPVTWLGWRSIVVSEQRVPEENWLVRVKAGALSEGVPSRDLLVTQEHCLVFEGRLVPARMLVNGVSVLLDRTIGSYTYYHVELATHEAIWAEGALTESYLDTGNRAQFANFGVTRLFADEGRVAGGSDGLPLDVSRGFVEPVWRAIAARAGVEKPGLPALTEDADLHLVTETGGVVRAHRVSGGRHVFRLPEGVETVVLASRTARPADVMGPFVDDRRELGVLVGSISLFGAGGRRELDAHLGAVDLPGWDVVEASACRWTNGAAVLPVGPGIAGEARVMSVQVLEAGPFAVMSAEAVVA